MQMVEWHCKVIRLLSIKLLRKATLLLISADEKQELHNATDLLTESKSVQVELTKKQVTKMSRQKFQKIQKIVSTDNISQVIIHLDNFNWTMFF